MPSKRIKVRLSQKKKRKKEKGLESIPKPIFSLVTTFYFTEISCLGLISPVSRFDRDIFPSSLDSAPEIDEHEMRGTCKLDACINVKSFYPCAQVRALLCFSLAKSFSGIVFPFRRLTPTINSAWPNENSRSFTAIAFYILTLSFLFNFISRENGLRKKLYV